MECDDEQPFPSPSPSPSLLLRPPTSSLLKDISNFKTPKRPSQIPNFQSPCPQNFFTASKQTPKSSSSSSFYRRGPPSARSKSTKTKTAAARRLKSLELEQSKSAYKSQLKKEQSLKSLSKSLTAWLNFLLENPKLCGCDKFDSSNVGNTMMSKGKREGGEVLTWRDPKRQRDTWWRGDNNDVEDDTGVSESKYLTLRNSLKDICSFDDLKQRMRIYLSLGSCKEVFDIMSRVTKNIDEGRLTMKSHCPIVTDFGMKEKATNVLMCYNPAWLRIGLYIIFGGDSLLSNEDVNPDPEMAFLKMIIENQVFSHAGLAKAYAYNKKVEGLYRPGYYETLGNVILKRFLLLVLILDRAKSQSILPLKYGIDGVDGGSPLLFSVQSSIKSSRQVIVDFLSSEVMHGEGNVFAHLVIVGYKVSYQQFPLLEYDFKVTNLFVDLQDGVRLGRVIQLLLQDSSILTKMVVPSDNQRKNLGNCGIALLYLRKAGVKLCDEDGTEIVEDDVANGDKELTLSLLWNMFVDLQEICKIHGTSADLLNSVDSSPLDLLLNWIQVICKRYEFCITDFSSLNDGKAVWCLLDFYFRKELCCSCSSKTLLEARGEESIVSITDYTDAFHNFILSQKLTMLLGNFPEVLQMSDILEHNGACSNRSVVILLVFLSSQLIVKKNTDQLNFHKLLGCNCQSPERRRSNSDCWIVNSEASSDRKGEAGYSTEVTNFKALQGLSFSISKSKIDIERDIAVVMLPGNAAKVIQFHFRRWNERRNFLKIRNAVSYLQIVVRAWLAVKHNTVLNTFNTKEEWKQIDQFGRYVNFMVERHHFVKLKRSVLIIQRATRLWMSHRHQTERVVGSCTPDILGGATDVQDCVHSFSEIDKSPLMCQENGESHLELQAAFKIQFAWRNFISSRFLQKNCFAATRIQSYFREVPWKPRCLIVMIQRHFRGWLIRRDFLLQRESAKKIQSAVRSLNCWRAFHSQKHAATEVQRFVRGQIIRSRLLGSSGYRAATPSGSNFNIQRGCFQSFELKIFLSSVLKLQRWWKHVLFLKVRTKSAIIIQSYIRGWTARRKASREKRRIVVLQSYWKGYLARKESSRQLLDLRLRVQNSAANVDDGMRIINRLLSALSELLSMKSVSGILHTCATLDMATEHSQKCCEKLVAAGAIDTLLKLIRSVSRSIPDQEILKHALSTLRNLARHPHLIEVLIDRQGSVETILWELLRNKDEGYFIASEILKKMCSTRKGVEAICKLPAHLKRLNNLVEELTRKANLEKRNSRSLVVRENLDRRLREAVELLKLIKKR
ncbi:Abnormal spindle-like microcephaly-associated protein-like [Melia azedarach]|uniref:Abnormal spindle-like microcephaly-associated protein-like n=1 Tax=Melia azedarach TaxID=155640 RepID=A0ACC1WW69_MELAZ|nr:Abnormal spindle-like microcephaly-associated protein-like [Melia azedarach]